MSRRISSSFTELARAVMIVRMEKKSVAPISTGRRPILSATIVKSKDPIRTPRFDAPGNAPFLDNGGSDVPESLHVEAIHDETHRAKREREDLEAADRAVVDHLGNVQLCCRRHSAF
jgi:hypothetical protein